MQITGGLIKRIVTSKYTVLPYPNEQLEVSRILSFKINQKMWAKEWIFWNYLRLNCSPVFLMLSCNSHPESQTDPPETSEIISPLSLLPEPNKDTGVTSLVHKCSPNSCSASGRNVLQLLNTQHNYLHIAISGIYHFNSSRSHDSYAPYSILIGESKEMIFKIITI